MSSHLIRFPTNIICDKLTTTFLCLKNQSTNSHPIIKPIQTKHSTSVIKIVWPFLHSNTVSHVDFNYTNDHWPFYRKQVLQGQRTIKME